MKSIPFVLTLVEGAWVCQKEELSPETLVSHCILNKVTIQTMFV